MKTKIQAIILFVLVFSTFAFYLIDNEKTDEYTKVKTVNFTSTVPSEPAGGYTSTPEQMAEFAWKEFVALNWPAATNSKSGSSGYKRGTASTTKTLGSTGADGTVVWETYAHRVELYPGAAKAGSTVPTLPSIEDAPVKYQYPFYVKTNAGSGVEKNLFNNLDEASEITLADMYFTPGVKANSVEASLLYEAKANNVIYDHVKKMGFQNFAPRNAAASNTLKKLENKSFSTPTFELPNGSIEIKATWRRYNSTTDNLDDFHHATAVWYSGKSPNFKVHNDTFVLIGLHIIQKTPKFPTFTFATFEHVSNEANGFQFKNTHAGVDSKTIPGRKIPETGLITAVRQYPIPDGSTASGGSFDLVTYNTNIQNQLKTQFGNSVVWANYQLIGIQGQVANNPNTSVPAQTFFLSNFATETNNSLQFFQGGLSGTYSNIVDPNLAKVYAKLNGATKYDTYTAGGCIGCHGAQGQAKGYDMSVISAKGNFFLPEPPEDYPSGITATKQDATGYPIPQKQSKKK